MTSNFFETLGTEVAAELARPSGRFPINAAQRQWLTTKMDATLNQHLSNPPPMAQDSAFVDLGTRYTLSQDSTRILDNQTGTSWDCNKVMRSIFPTQGHPKMPSNRVRRLMGQDQDMPDPAGMTYNQDQEELGASPPSPDECFTFIQMLLQKLGPEEHDALIARLSDLISTAHNNGTEVAPGDRGFRGGRTVRDQVPNNNLGSLDRRTARDNRGTRSGAMDSAIQTLNHSSFARRFPDAMHIRFGGTGR